MVRLFFVLIILFITTVLRINYYLYWWIIYISRVNILKWKL